MATKRKTKRFSVGGMSDEDVKSFAGTPENDSNAGMVPEAGMMEKEPAENFKPTPRAKAPIVTKDQLSAFQKKYGADKTLRDYMNDQKGLTRRGSATDELSSVAKNRADAYKEAEAKARTPEGRAERQKQIEGQAVERVTPEANFLPGASIKTIAGLAKGLAGRHAAQGVEKLAEYSTPILEGGRKMLAGPMKQLGMKKGGAVKSAPKASSASRRADGMASKGKTKGRMV